MGKSRVDKKTVLAFAVSAIMISGLIFANFFMLYRSIRENTIRTRENEVVQAAADANYFLRESVDSVRMAAYAIDSMQENGASSQEILDYLTRESAVYTNALNWNFTGLYGVFGGVYLDGIGWEPEPGYVPQERPWYTAAARAKGQVTLVTPYLDSQTGSIMMSISKLLSDGESVVSLDISLDGIQKMTEENVAHHIWRSAMILDSNGFVVAHSDEGELGKEYLQEEGSLGNLIAKGLNASGGRYFEVSYGGESYLVFQAAIGDDWHALAVVGKSRLLGSMQGIYIVFFITLLLIFGFIGFIFLKIQQKQSHAENLNRQIMAMAKIYEAVQLINLPEDTFKMVSGGLEEEDGDMQFLLGEKQEHAQNALRATMDAMTDVRFKKSMFDFINFSTLQERLDGKNTVTKEYIDSPNRRCRARFVPVEWNEDKTLKYVMWMVEIIEDR